MRYCLPLLFFLLIIFLSLSLFVYRRKATQEKVEKKLRAAIPHSDTLGLDAPPILKCMEPAIRVLRRHPRLPYLVFPSAILLLITRSPWSLPLAIPFYWLLPRWIERFRESRNQKKIRDQLFDFIDCVIQSLEAGSSVFQSLELAATEMDEPLASELQLTVAQINLGEDFEDALRSLGERMDNSDLQVIITAIILLKQSGGNLPALLRKLGDMMQDRQEIEREIKVYTVQGRLSGYVVSALPIAFLLIESAFSRQFVRPLFTTPLGLILLLVGLFMETVGFLWIRKISQLGMEKSDMKKDGPRRRIDAPNTRLSRLGVK